MNPAADFLADRMSRAELDLIRDRGDAPLVRLKRDFDGFSKDTLGTIKGVKGAYVMVRFAGGVGDSWCIPNELENV